MIKETLHAISNYPGGYGAIYDLIYPNESNPKDNSQVLRNRLSKLKKGGLLSNEKGIWKITPEGKIFLKKEKSTLIKFTSFKNIKLNPQKTMLVIFDIPEKKRLYRNWLRNELVGFGFTLIQKSVWFGPTLPKEFITYLSDRKILEYIKFFKATEKDLI
jgi:CRISPR-associated endonuclease Cas2